MSKAQNKKPSNAWGQAIGEERQTELQGYLDKWAAETDHGDRPGPFHPNALDAADVSWIAEQFGSDGLHGVPNLHLEGADLRPADLSGTLLIRAHLEKAYLPGVNMEEADLSEIHLEGASLNCAHLERAKLWQARLDGAILTGVRLEGADLREAHLEGADLQAAH